MRFFLLAALLGCNGVIGEPADLGPNDDPVAWDPDDPDAPIPDFSPGDGATRRLTTEQYRNIVHTIFGDVSMTRALEADEVTTEFSTHGAAQVSTSNTGVEQYRDAAMEIAEQVWSNRSAYPVLADCGPATATDPCIEEAVGYFGRRLFRRSLTGAELSRYAGIVAAAPDEYRELGMQYALAALLQSPHFIYVPAIGEPEDGMRRRTSSEIASLLALLLWNEGPDEALIDAADADALQSVEEIRARAEQMLDDERARDLASRFLSESWHFAHVEDTDKRVDRFPEWSDELLADFRTETELVLAELTHQRDGDFLDVLDGSTTFVNQRLADFYGLDVTVDGFEQVDLDESRSGLLTSGMVIAANSPSDRSTPTERGVFVLNRLQCRDLPSPPQEALEAGQEELAMLEPGDERGFIERRLENPDCSGCHQTIDPLGMVFDDYNAIGRFRMGEDSIGELGSEPYDSALELATDLRTDRDVAFCMVQRLYSYVAGRNATYGETKSLVEASSQFDETEHSFRELMIAIVTSEGFRFVREEE